MYDLIGIGLFLAAGMFILWFALANPRGVMRGKWDRTIFAVVGLVTVLCAGALAWLR
ncbi:MAG: hypothetical protein BroJett013_07500 [Alphaproteobacteria bacterium]|nr:MAG: hypothetical protein BroJett013_07500 [Alphaproteobacteria bacterium]